MEKPDSRNESGGLAPTPHGGRAQGSPGHGKIPILDILSLLPKRPMINVVDVGAMSLGEGQDPYQPLITAGIANIIGFEPVEEELAKLNAMARPGRSYLPYAIGDGSVQRFNICNFPMTSSLLEPNHDLTDHFSDLSELMQVVKTVELRTHRLDDIPEMSDADFLKLDVQGAELQILRSARDVLSKVLMVQTEVEFVPLYKNQPLFADIDICLRESGFVFHRFTHLAGRPFRPLRFKLAGCQPSHTQVLWADAIYFRDFCRLAELGPDALLKLAVLAHLLCDSFDLAHKYLAAYDRLMDTAVSDAYLRELTAPA